MPQAFNHAAQNHVVRGVICSLVGALLWGFSGTSAQFLLSHYDLPTFWLIAVRMAVSALLFIVLTIAIDWRNFIALFRDWKSLLEIMIFGIIGVLMMQGTYLMAISYSNAGTATMIEQLGLILILFAACFKTRRLPSLREFLGLVCALTGMVLIATQGDLSHLAISREGLFWGLLSAVALALYVLMPGRVLDKWGSLIVTGVALTSGGIVSCAFVQPWSIPVHLDLIGLLGLGCIVLLGTLGAYIFYLQGVKDAGPVRASLLCCIEPVAAMIFSFVLLGTAISFFDILGCVFILTMVLLVTQREDGVGDPSLDSEIPDAPIFLGRASELGFYAARKAVREDFAIARKIIDDANVSLEEFDLKEKPKKYPSSRRLMHSVKNGSTYIIEDNHKQVIGVFAVSLDKDKNYDRVISGGWITDSPEDKVSYAELHWVSVCPKNRRRGVGTFILGKAEHIARHAGKLSIRADVFDGNTPMVDMLLKQGYTYCGKIAIKDYLGRERHRLIFEKIIGNEA